MLKKSILVKCFTKMAIKLVREFKQSQQLSITPQLKKSIDLLQLSRLEIINKINGLDNTYYGIIINPGGLTHTSVSLHDSLEIKDFPKIEVHISNIYSREEFRQKSIIAHACTSSIIGMGINGYLFALRHIVNS